MQKTTDEWCVNKHRRRPLDKIMDAIAAYQRGEKIQVIDTQLKVPPSVLYRWLPRYGIQMRGNHENYRKTEPATNVKAALMAYAKGRKVESIVKEFNTDFRSLYKWIERYGVSKRRAFHTGKAGHPPKAPWVYKCDWCGNQLSEYQVKRRRKYCCRTCQVDGIEDVKRRACKPCAAPGCEARVPEPNMLYCDWKCFQTAMKELFD